MGIRNIVVDDNWGEREDNAESIQHFSGSMMV